MCLRIGTTTVSYSLLLLAATVLAKDAEFRSRKMQIKMVPYSDIKAYDANAKFNPKPDFKPTGIESLPQTAGTSLHQHLKLNGGGRSQPGEFPWHTLLKIDDTWLCAGSLISVDWVLTAAHCVTGAKSVQIILGISERSNETEASQHQSSKIVVHNKYFDDFLANDIALVKLDSPASLDANINLVRLPALYQSTIKASPLHNMVASGFGNDEDTKDVLNYVDMHLIKNSNCAGFYGAEIISGSVICAVATSPNKSCGADSGGPLVMLEPDGLYTLMGVLSFGEAKTCDRFPVAFTRVSSFLGWISLVTGIQIRK